MSELFDFSIDVDISLWDAARGEIGEKSERSLMWAMREAGRAIKAHGQGSAPVLTGALRDSIKTSRNIQGGPDLKYMLVGPFGEPMAFYSGKQQARSAYMQGGPGEGRGGSALMSALSKVLAKFG